MNKNIIRVPNPFTPILLSTKVNQICPKTNVIYINIYDSVHTLQELLRQHNIHSVPVVENGSCIGMVDGLDIAKFYFLDPSTFQERSYSSTMMVLLAQNNTTLPVFAHTSLLDTISIVAPGIHRAIVLHSESNHVLYSVCSESDIIASLYCYLTVDTLARPAQTISKLPICTFSNYLANIKYNINCNETIQTGVDYISKSLTSTTTQYGVNVAVDEAISSPPQPAPTIDLPLADGDKHDLEWNAPIVAVIEDDHIIGYLNNTILHNNIICTDNTINMSHNLTKTVKDYLATFSPNNQSRGSLGFVVKHTISLYNIIKLMTEHKMDYVWVVTDESLFDQYTTQHNSALDHTTNINKIDNNVDYFQLNEDKSIPAAWYYKQQLAIITLNDVLRLVSRDNVWLNADLLDLYGDIN